MDLGVPMSVYLFFNALTALTAEADWTGTSPGTDPQNNRTANKTQADSVEGLTALKFSHSCLEDHSSYCINGVCAFHHELGQAICRCYTGYTGERCEHLTLTSYAADSYEKHIAAGIGIGLLLSGFLATFLLLHKKQCLNLKSPYNMCSRGKQPL